MTKGKKKKKGRAAKAKASETPVEASKGAPVEIPTTDTDEALEIPVEASGEAPVRIPREAESMLDERARLSAAIEELNKRLAVFEVKPLGPMQDVEHVWVRYRRGFGYGGDQVDWGQIVKLKGLRNDQKLLELGHFQPLEKDAERFQCGVCGAEFYSDIMRTAHGELRHRHSCVCDEVFRSAEELAQHQRNCGQWQSVARQVSPGVSAKDWAQRKTVQI